MNTAMGSFVKLSALLTGIAADKLAPAVDPVDIKQTYFDCAQQEGGATFDRLLAIFDANASQPPATTSATSPARSCWPGTWAAGTTRPG